MFVSQWYCCVHGDGICREYCKGNKLANAYSIHQHIPLSSHLCIWGLTFINIMNGIVREIAKSVLRDGRFQSYLALRGPSWLHDRLARERN
ncbi:hypothetical protein YC2023_035879 [Brassica napus]